MITKKFTNATSSQITIPNSVVNLGKKLSEEGEDLNITNCDTWVIGVEDAAIRILWDGNEPAGTLGLKFLPYQTISIIGATARNINIIRDGTATVDAKINIQAGKAVMNMQNVN